MKLSVFGFASVALFALTTLVVASPTPSTDITVKRQDFDDVDVIIASLTTQVQGIDSKYNTTCSGSCQTTTVSSWCQEIADACYTAIDKCKKIPSGHKFPDKNKCVNLVVVLLLEIQFTLKFLLSKCGLLGIIIGVVDLVAVLIAALSALLITLAVFVDGLLAAVSVLLYSIVGALGCLLCTLGLAI